MRLVLVGVFLSAIACFQNALADDEGIRFRAVDVFITSTEPLAAWQFELRDPLGRMQVVGVEQGDSAAFDRAPYYDRDAVELGRADRIVVADYSLAEESRLPRGRTRVATVHLMLRGEPDLDLRLITATDGNGRVIDATISLEPTTGSEQ